MGEGQDEEMFNGQKAIDGSAETSDVEDEGIGEDGSTVSIGPIRELVLKAHPDVVPELVRGESVEELLDSVEPARQAFARIVEELAAREERSGGQASRRPVPAGGSHAPLVDVDALPASEMLRRGIAGRA